MTANILHVYKNYEAAFSGFKAVESRLTSYGLDFKAYEPNLKIRSSEWTYIFSVCITREDAWRHAGMRLDVVVFNPHEDNFDKDVVQCLKCLVKQPKEQFE